ncbi:MAG TPA: single-stranded-DNA-specific exonuclease RecJ [Candidatus Paceibacterota bacterium]|nr:single-stranded-DNA-specific exonuclease RecJ [Candidatus Paceibacterota bacterium]
MPNHTELLDLLLSNRGIRIEDRERFLNPSYEEHIFDPFLMLNMDTACVRIFEATEAKEKIVIYSDYDCDGIPASVIMNDFFEKIGYSNYSIYIPDRHDEGYGLHHDAIDQFINDEVKLLITFDLGITAIEEVAKAQAAGMDVIITDHHLPQEELPRAYAVLNPKQDKCEYPDKMLCGAGIAFKLVQALVKKYGEYWKINNGWEKWLLDMAGVATLSDQVPLLNENRVLAYYGLKVLQKGKRPGLVELFKKSGADISNLNEEDITFTLAPRINAASRMSDPMKAYELLATKNLAEARTLSDFLVKTNNERKVMVAHIMKDVKNILQKREEKPLIVIGNPAWRIGVLGIIASKITEEYKKPSFVWGGNGNGDIHGSCRGYGNVNLVEIMSLLPENALLGFGGHKSAGGFSTSHEEIHFLEERLIEVFESKYKIEEIEKDYIVDANITLDDVNNENFNVIKKLAPFGVGNPKPTFLLKGIKIDDIKEFGKEKNHLELSFKNSRGRAIKAISFFKTRNSFISILEKGNIINLVATMEQNTFAGKNELRLRIVDIL